MTLLTEERVRKALEQSRGLVASAARSLGCSRQAIYDWMERVPSLKTILDDERELLIDKAENVIANAIDAGNLTAAGLVVRTIGRARGYSERVETVSTGAEDDTKAQREIAARLQGMSTAEREKLLSALGRLPAKGDGHDSTTDAEAH